MSQTTLTSAAGAGRWAHMASVMSEVLDAAVRHGSVRQGEPPLAVLGSAQLFFRLAAGVSEGRVPDNPQASVANYRIAADVIRASATKASETPVEISARIAEYAKFVAELGRTAALNEQELKTAQELRDFFHELALEAASDRYESVVDTPLRGLRFA